MFQKIKIALQVHRIKRMEALLDNVLASENKENVKAELNTLFSYYFGKQWKQDFDADEKGLLPKDLKRGVLTEDTLYNLYTEFQDQLK